MNNPAAPPAPAAPVTPATSPSGAVPPAAVLPPVTAYAWYVLALLTVAQMLASIDRSIISVVIEPLRAEFRFNDSELGFLTGLAFGIPYALAGLPLGFVVDRVNRRKFLSCMIAIWSVLTALCGFAQNYIQLVLARMMVGAAEAGLPAAPSLLTDYFAAKRRPMALGVYVSGGSAAFVLSFALGGWVAHEWGWREVFHVVGLPGLVVAALLFFTVREPARGATEEQAGRSDEQKPSFGETLRFLFSRRAFLHLYIGYVLVGASASSFWSWIGSLLIRIHGLSVRDAGLVVAVGAGMCGFLGALFGAMMADRLGRRGFRQVLAFVAIAAGLLAPVGIGMSLASSLVLTIALMVLLSILKSCYLGPVQGMMLSIARVRMRGVTSSLLAVSATLIGFGLGPLIAGTISALMGGGEAIRFGLGALFLFNLWAAIHFWAARAHVEADLAAEA